MKLTEKLLRLLEKMDANTAFKILGLKYGDVDGVKAAYRKLAMLNHPDRGGDMEKMKDINQAKDAIEDQARSGFSGGSSYSSRPKSQPRKKAEPKKKREPKQKKEPKKKTTKARKSTSKKSDRPVDVALLQSSIVAARAAVKDLTGYFEHVTGKRHSVESKAFIIRQTEGVLVSTFTSDDNMTQFILNLSVAGRKTSELFDIELSTEMYRTARNIKLVTKKWSADALDTKMIADVTHWFPQEKIKSEIEKGA